MWVGEAPSSLRFPAGYYSTVSNKTNFDRPIWLASVFRGMPGNSSEPSEQPHFIDTVIVSPNTFSFPTMSQNYDEETKTLLDNGEHLTESPKVKELGEIWFQKPIPPRVVYFVCFILLALNAGLLVASWHAQREIKELYSSMGRDIESLPRPDPFAGLSAAAKSNAGGEKNI
ncbi:hypothetical protein NP233_g2027 [Leucocoprinus birnbaumii]|uniref:Uncharacterized protein n=1 Tax=Leucocoprinus birnbaumii TaxID=56174 RepID=A0AAD5W308_9AGAR|nr:hypothetical protein NP233_g2027 [Leucocoprinus birnbaumii]